MTKRSMAAISSGVLLILSFAPFGLWPLSLAAFVPLLLSIEGTAPGRRFLLGLLSGIVFFTGTVYWVVHSMHLYGGLGLGTSVPVMLLLAAYLAIYFGLFAIFAGSMPGSPSASLFYIPALWVGTEFLRARLFTGFPWVLSGYALTGDLHLMQAADIAGVWGLSFVVMLVNAAIYLIISRGVKGRPWPRAVVAVTAMVLIGAAAYGELRIRQVDRASRGWPALRAAVAQGNIDQSVKWDKEYQGRTLAIYSRLTARAAREGARLVVWPETAVPFYLERNERGKKRVTGVARTNRVTLLTGSPAYDYNGRNRAIRFFNSAYVISMSGAIRGRYDKVHLVPYGEYVPLKRLMPFIKKLTVGVGDFVPGPGPVPLVLDGKSAGVLICYEAIFPELAREEVKRGASVLINITNDAWFGKTAAPYQHLEMARLRAVENRVYMLRAANTGISAVIGPSGRIKERSALFTEDVLTTDVGLRKGPHTIYTRYGDYFAYASMVFAGVVILMGTARRRRGMIK